MTVYEFQPIVRTAVIERFPDGSKAKHYFVSEASALYAMSENTDRHPDRTYEIADLS